jgi:chemotaxis-related protein WspB
MLFLLFRLGDDRYALDVREVIEILPLVGIKEIPQAPAGVAGLFDCRGVPTPAIDLSALALGRPAACRLSTRIIVVPYPDHSGQPRALGLIAEKATETMRRAETDFVDAGVDNVQTPYLGPVASDSRGLIQRIEVSRLLPSSVRDVLFHLPA